MKMVKPERPVSPGSSVPGFDRSLNLKPDRLAFWKLPKLLLAMVSPEVSVSVVEPLPEGSVWNQVGLPTSRRVFAPGSRSERRS